MRHENGRSSGFARACLRQEPRFAVLAIFGLMREEIEARSAEQVARMERERGFPDGIRLA